MVADGKDPNGAGISLAQVNNIHVDMITEHYYWGDYTEKCIKARMVCKDKKVFYVGEFNHADVSVHEKLLNEILRNGTSGALVWSLHFHTKDGGFYYHQEHNDASNPCYRWPGFPTANITHEKDKMIQLRNYAFKIEVWMYPPYRFLILPHLLKKAFRINSDGKDPSAQHRIQLKDQRTGQIGLKLEQNATEDGIPYRPYRDQSAKVGIGYFYRVKAINDCGVSKPSNIIGPIYRKTMNP